MDESEMDLAWVLRREGLLVPQGWGHGVLAGYRELRRMAAVIHDCYGEDVEPASVYRMIE